MPRSASIPAGVLAFLSLALTIYLFNVAEAPQDRNTLLGFLIAEGVFITWLIWSFSQPEAEDENDPIPVPRSRPFETTPAVPTRAPQPSPPYQHRPLQPSRPPARSSDPLPPASVQAHAEAIGADLWLVGRDFNFSGDKLQWAWAGRGRRYSGLAYPALRGANQLVNAAGVLAALNDGAKARPIWSVALPAAKGTMALMGLLG